MDCDDDDPCTEDRCDENTGECYYVCTPDGVMLRGGTCPMTVVIKEITFQNDCTMYEEAPPCVAGSTEDCWGAGPALGNPDWKHATNPDHPACYVRGTTMRFIVKLEVTGGGDQEGSLRVTGPDGIVGEQGFTGPCGTTEDRFVTITTNALPNVVKAYTRATLSWSVKEPGATSFTPITTTNHRIYVTFGTPSGSLPTNRRLNTFCYAAAQASIEDAAALAVWDY